MAIESQKDFKRAKRLLAWYNMIPNLVWSVINLVPISIFCYSYMDIRLLLIFSIASFVPVFFKNSFLDKMRVGNTTGIYKKLGVHIINKVAQNGDLINSFVRKKFPNYKGVELNKMSIRRLVSQTYFFEKFHLVLFLFFILTTTYALLKRYFWWSFFISLSNIGYNVYPNLLQQYIRLKLVLFQKRLEAIK